MGCARRRYDQHYYGFSNSVGSRSAGAWLNDNSPERSAMRQPYTSALNTVNPAQHRSGEHALRKLLIQQYPECTGPQQAANVREPCSVVPRQLTLPREQWLHGLTEDCRRARHRSRSPRLGCKAAHLTVEGLREVLVLPLG